MLPHAYLLAKFGFDTAENEPCKFCQKAINLAKLQRTCGPVHEAHVQHLEEPRHAPHLLLVQPDDDGLRGSRGSSLVVRKAARSSGPVQGRSPGSKVDRGGGDNLRTVPHQRGPSDGQFCQGLSEASFVVSASILRLKNYIQLLGGFCFRALREFSS